MDIVYIGKTKNVYEMEDGNYLLKFKDDMTGENGKFDPGANTVGLSVEGAGRAGLRLTKFFFEALEKKGIPTHYIDADIENSNMMVKPAETFGKGLEVICRYRATGSFFSRYGDYVRSGEKLNGFVEVTLKDDKREDPVISEDALEILDILDKNEYKTLKDLTLKTGNIVREELAKRDIELYDIKFEFGRLRDTGEIVLIDEISGGNMRAFKGDHYISPLELEKLILDDGKKDVDASN